jgi:hypothetical protein
MTHWTDIPYWAIKGYFSVFWAAWLASLYFKWNEVKTWKKSRTNSQNHARIAHHGL